MNTQTCLDTLSLSAYHVLFKETFTFGLFSPSLQLVAISFAYLSLFHLLYSCARAQTHSHSHMHAARAAKNRRCLFVFVFATWQRRNLPSVFGKNKTPTRYSSTTNTMSFQMNANAFDPAVVWQNICFALGWHSVERVADSIWQCSKYTVIDVNCSIHLKLLLFAWLHQKFAYGNQLTSVRLHIFGFNHRVRCKIVFFEIFKLIPRGTLWAYPESWWIPPSIWNKHSCAQIHTYSPLWHGCVFCVWVYFCTLVRSTYERELSQIQQA